MRKPIVAMTIGDPAGVGPEVVAAAWSSADVHAICRPVVVGNPEVLRRATSLRGIQAEVVEIGSIGDILPSPARLPCLMAGSVAAAEVLPGVIDARGGQAAFDALLEATRLALAGEFDAIVTAPLHKAALWQAGHHYPGHTELLAELCGVQDFAMMLYLGPDAAIRSSGGLGVAHVTLHMALRDVFGQLTHEAILAKARLVHQIMTAIKGSRPRIGVCALNPHGGEEGLFGDEELRIIAPAVETARAEGLDIAGPFPTDTLMVHARDGAFDGIVAMYHDQGHIALKLLGMHRAVNITLGLPIVRTSVAHGTAFDIAWRGIAQESSVIEAIRVATLLANQRRGVTHQLSE